MPDDGLSASVEYAKSSRGRVGCVFYFSFLFFSDNWSFSVRDANV